MKEFKINEYITLKLEEEGTSIYVNGEYFEQCRFLMLDIPLRERERFDEIKSIDEAADILGWTEEGQEGVEYDIDPETEFWGHCSNIQAWAENMYDTRILHRNLAFPLLKKLTEVGDAKAKVVFKEEIGERFQDGNQTVRRFLTIEGYLDYLNKEEFKAIFSENLISDYISGFVEKHKKTVKALSRREYEFDDLHDNITFIFNLLTGGIDFESIFSILAKLPVQDMIILLSHLMIGEGKFLLNCSENQLSLLFQDIAVLDISSNAAEVFHLCSNQFEEINTEVLVKLGIKGIKVILALINESYNFDWNYDYLESIAETLQRFPDVLKPKLNEEVYKFFKNYDFKAKKRKLTIKLRDRKYWHSKPEDQLEKHASETVADDFDIFMEFLLPQLDRTDKIKFLSKLNIIEKKWEFDKWYSLDIPSYLLVEKDFPLRDFVFQRIPLKERKVLYEFETLTGRKFDILNARETSKNPTILIGKENHVIKLYVRRCNLHYIPRSISDLTQLKYFDIVENEVSSFPKEFFQLSKLTHLVVPQNKISVIPDSISNLTELQQIHLDHNQVKILPDSIGTLKNLEILGVNANPLKNLPTTIGKLNKLEHLWVDSDLYDEAKKIVGRNTKIAKL